MGFEAGDRNLYRFVGNHPTIATDPSGLAEQPNWSAIGLNTLTGAVTGGRAKMGKWEVKMTPFNSSESKDERAGLEGTVTFTPDPQKCPQTKSIRLVQTWRRLNEDGTYELFNADHECFEANKVTLRQEHGKLGFQMGWRVDYLPAKIDKTEAPKPYYKEYFPVDNTNDGQNINGKVQFASLGDRPAGYVDGARYEFETIAVNTETGEYLGAVRWGYVLSSKNVGNKLVTFATPLPVTELAYPSAPSIEAIKLFFDFYKARW